MMRYKEASREWTFLPAVKTQTQTEFVTETEIESRYRGMGRRMGVDRDRIFDHSNSIASQRCQG